MSRNTPPGAALSRTSTTSRHADGAASTVPAAGAASQRVSKAPPGVSTSVKS
jgi:hypothetical protein